MTTFAIFDTNAGLLQWLGEAESSTAAILAFNDKVGLIEEANDDLNVAAVDAEQAAALSRWQESGAPADEYPSGIVVERISAEHVGQLLGFTSER